MTLADEDTNSILANNAFYDTVADAGDVEDVAEDLPPASPRMYIRTKNWDFCNWRHYFVLHVVKLTPGVEFAKPLAFRVHSDFGNFFNINATM